MNCIIDILSADQASSTMSDKPRLLSLPVELRLQIYSHLETPPSPIEYPLAEPHSSQASFILTCRQLRYELQHDFFSNNVFAIRFNSDGHMSSTKHPTSEEFDTLNSEFRRTDNNLPRDDSDFEHGVPMLKPYGKQRFTDLRPFDRCSALSEDLTKIEDLQLHVLHRHLYGIHPVSLNRILRPPDMLPDYPSKCKEQLKVVLEALVRAKSMKGPLGLKKLTIVDNVPYISLYEIRFKELRELLADAYRPVLRQAAATLGISIGNVKIEFDPFRAFKLVRDTPSESERS